MCEYHKWESSSWGIILGVTKCLSCGTIAKSGNLNQMTCCGGLSLEARVKPPHNLEPGHEEPDDSPDQDDPRPDAGPEDFHLTATLTTAVNTSGAYSLSASMTIVPMILTLSPRLYPQS